MTQPIDYARAESADVGRKKHRRRVVWFLVATVVASLISLAWISPPFPKKGFRWGETNTKLPFWMASSYGRLIVYGQQRTQTVNVKWSRRQEEYTYRAIGIEAVRSNVIGRPKWAIAIRYRTLFTLAMIPWIITLIRLIRIRRQIHQLDPEPRTNEPRTQ